MRVFYHTFGCKANQYDTERMRQEAEARGAPTTAERSNASVFVVNTCTVTNQADAEARRFIRRLHREHPEASIVVTGCSATLKQADYEAMPGVSGVVPGHEPVSVATTVLPSAPTQIEIKRSLDRIHTEPVGGELLRRRRGAARGWLKVQDGCDRKCSFCATRLARGASRSRSPDEVVAEARLLATRHAELVVTGVHIGHYGLDLSPAESLSRLCARLLDGVPDVRFRLGSIEATEVDDLLVELLEGSGGRLAPHLHMPLQSGADPVLRRMRRWHTREQYRKRALEIAERVHPLGLGADVITGFPGETEADHASTRSLIDELPYTYLHVFPYSPRDGTAALDLSDPVPQRIAGERSRDLRELVDHKGRSYRASRSGTGARVVVEGSAGTGLTGDYLRVRTPDGDASEDAVLDGVLRGGADDLRIDASRQM
ncbi:MAG: MiaB/RimO family radical SAM methylthiotransferase [Gemmatimonadota bacterium]|jgi:threonylcarbamoyladenosine tRNA methylthiotransferase MtaB